MNFPYRFSHLGACLLLWAFVSCDDSDEPGCSGQLSLAIINQSSARCESGGSVEVTAQGNSGSAMYRLNSQSFQNSGTFENLAAGSYQITAQDETGCETTLAVTIDEAASDLTINNITISPSACSEASGSLVVEAQGGNPDYQYRIDADPFQSSAEFSNLSPGEYTIVVQDANGCQSEMSALVTSDVSFSNVIQDIISTDCAVTGCHVAGTNLPNFSEKSNIIDRAARIRSRTTARTMPPPNSGRSLTDEQIAQIACWVEDGAPDN
ncbi:MAG: hypothetical protein ACFB15_08615 [Cyclobacteriaceae bacterium]